MPCRAKIEGAFLALPVPRSFSIPQLRLKIRKIGARDKLNDGIIVPNLILPLAWPGSASERVVLSRGGRVSGRLIFKPGVRGALAYYRRHHSHCNHPADHQHHKHLRHHYCAIGVNGSYACRPVSKTHEQ